MQTLSSHSSGQTGDALGVTPFAFLRTIQSSHVSLQLQGWYIPIALWLWVYPNLGRKTYRLYCFCFGKSKRWLIFLESLWVRAVPWPWNQEARFNDIGPSERSPAQGTAMQLWKSEAAKQRTKSPQPELNCSQQYQIVHHHFASDTQTC